jgi:hypothetical protein
MIERVDCIWCLTVVCLYAGTEKGTGGVEEEKGGEGRLQGGQGGEVQALPAAVGDAAAARVPAAAAAAVPAGHDKFVEPCTKE